MNNKDLHSEKALLACVCQYGLDAYADIDYITNECFVDQSNALIFDILKSIVERGAKPDIPLILSTANDKGFGAFFERPEELGFIRSLFNLPITLGNVGQYAIKLKKKYILDKLKQINVAVNKDLSKLTGQESIQEMMEVVEKPLAEILNSVYGIEEREPIQIFQEMENYIYELMEDSSKYTGLKTGFDHYDQAIGGGLRRQSVDVVAGRPKAQPLHSKVLTPKGFVPIGSLRVGDTICHPDGGVSKIEYVYEHGVKPVYKFNFSDQTSCLATSDHLWKVKNRRKSKWSVMSLDQIMKFGIKESDRNKWQFPLLEKVFLESSSNKILHPYILGVLLGDGSIQKGCRFTNSSQFIQNKVNSLLSENYEVRRNGKKSFFAIVKKEPGNKPNMYTEELERLKLLGAGSYEKFIPQEYLNETYENRVHLLNGLFDTDGDISKDGKTLSYSTVSEKLANGVVELVRSLGGKVKISKRTTSYNDKICNSYRVYASFNDNGIVFTKPEKLSRSKSRKKPNIKRTLDSVEYIGDEECRCIKIDNPDGLYITDDYIVTHNSAKSTMGLQIGLNLASRGVPVLIIDTEMNIDGIRNRSIANQSGVDINEITSTEIKKKQAKFKQVIKTAQKKHNLPIYHINVAGMDFKSILAIMKKWLMKRVGRDETGRLKDCLIVYDYLKLTTSDEISKDMQEYQLLGFQMTELYNFMVRNDCACLAYVQLNRGMDVSQSDRIKWLCTSFTKFLLKSDEEMAEDIANGMNPPYNRKLEVECSRWGPGTEFGNYINLRVRGQFATIDAGPTRDEANRKTNIDPPDISTCGTGADPFGSDGGEV